MKSEEKLARIAAAQYGVFSRRQALDAGVHASTINRRLASGRWQRVYHSVYRFPGTSRSWHQRLMAALLLMGEDAAVSHRAAAALHGFPGFKPGLVELTITGGRRRPPDGVVLHHTDRWMRGDRAKTGGLVVTSIARTLIDLGSVEPEDVVEIALESTLGRRQVTVDQLVRKLDELGGHGRRGAAVMRRLLLVRLPGYTPTASVFEIKFLQMLRRHLRPLPERQYVITEDNEFVARVDFAFPDRKLAIECESFEHHSDLSDWEDDAKRYNRLASLGWRIVRVTWSDLAEPDRILADIFPEWPSDAASR
jgi:very-short-patch-repair endonuclease